jgi:protein TonB
VNRRLFEDLVVSTRGRRGGRGGLAFPASVGIHAVIVGGAILLSVFGPGDLMPEAAARPTPILAPVVQIVPPTIASRNQVAPPSRAGRRGGGPPGVPRVVPAVVDAPGPPDPDDFDTEPVGCLGPDCDPEAPPGPSIPDPTAGDDVASPSPSIVRASEVAQPVKTRNVEPIYPEPARRARVEGVVIIECTIDPKGRIANAHVLRGHPLLDGAALDAVQQWVYRPSLLNGAPVSVVMTVTVNFKIPR